MPVPRRRDGRRTREADGQVFAIVGRLDRGFAQIDLGVAVEGRVIAFDMQPGVDDAVYLHSLGRGVGQDG